MRFDISAHLVASGESIDNLTLVDMASTASQKSQRLDDAEVRSRPRISVAVCAYNAAAFLPDCIASLMAKCIAPAEYEVLVIDNNSTDNTSAVIRAAQERYGARLKLLTEQEQGLSAARNCALNRAESSL